MLKYTELPIRFDVPAGTYFGIHDNPDHSEVGYGFRFEKGRTCETVDGRIVARLHYGSGKVSFEPANEETAQDVLTHLVNYHAPTERVDELRKLFAQLFMSEAEREAAAAAANPDHALDGEVSATQFEDDALTYLRSEGLVRTAPGGHEFVREPEGEQLDRVTKWFEDEAARLTAAANAKFEAERVAAAAKAAAEAKAAEEAAAKAKAAEAEEAAFQEELARENARNAVTAVDPRPATSADDTQRETPTAKSGKANKK